MLGVYLELAVIAFGNRFGIFVKRIVDRCDLGIHQIFVDTMIWDVCNRSHDLCDVSVYPSAGRIVFVWLIVSICVTGLRLAESSSDMKVLPYLEEVDKSHALTIDVKGCSFLFVLSLAMTGAPEIVLIISTVPIVYRL